MRVVGGSQARRRLTGASIGAAAMLLGVPCAEAARLVVTSSRAETLYSVSSDPDCGWSQWQTIAQPREVHEQILAAIRKSKQGGLS